MSAYSLRIRGFIRGSIPLSSTIKRLVRRGSGKAYGQKPKMYGHADRIDGRDKVSGKLPVLLDCCALTAYSCPMTTSENAQRDELARELFITDNSNQPREQSLADWYWLEDADHYRVGGQRYKDVAARILSTANTKPRIITTIAEVDALPVGSVIFDGDEVALEKTGGGWRHKDSFPSSDLALPVIVVGEVEAVA